MVVDSDRTILVLDRVGRPLAPEDADAFDATAKRCGAAGGIPFEQAVELPDDDSDQVLSDRQRHDLLTLAASMHETASSRDGMIDMAGAAARIRAIVFGDA